MGKSLIQQKRGKGGPRYRAPSFRYKGSAHYDIYNPAEVSGALVTEFVHCAGHSAPLLELEHADGKKSLLPASEGLKIGDEVMFGGSQILAGNILALKDIPAGIPIFNIEAQPGDGGKFVRCSGVFAKIITKLDNGAIVLLPSSKRKVFNLECRATIGIVAGSGRKDKPFLKAGRKFYAMRAKNKLYPIVCGTSMNSVNHPFGGKSSHAKGIPTQSSRNAPPGRKVGKIAPKRTGRRKR